MALGHHALEFVDDHLLRHCSDDLIRYLQEDKIRLDDIISHRLSLDEAPRGYEIFNEKKEDCVKVVLTP
jgi:alcohol dehydrogenase